VRRSENILWPQISFTIVFKTFSTPLSDNIVLGERERFRICESVKNLQLSRKKGDMREFGTYSGDLNVNSRNDFLQSIRVDDHFRLKINKIRIFAVHVEISGSCYYCTLVSVKMFKEMCS